MNNHTTDLSLKLYQLLLKKSISPMEKMNRFSTSEIWPLHHLISLTSNLHLWMHAAVDYGCKSTGWASSDQTVSSWRQHCLFILIESFQWRVLAWTLQLVPVEMHRQKTSDVFKQCVAVNRKLLYLEADITQQTFWAQLIMLHFCEVQFWHAYHYYININLIRNETWVNIKQ